jgi:hypothetical protein
MGIFLRMVDPFDGGISGKPGRNRQAAKFCRSVFIVNEDSRTVRGTGSVLIG